MLSAVKEELKRLAADPDDPFHSKVRKRIGKRATLILEKRLKQMILIMPGLLNRIRIHWAAGNSSPQVRKMGSFLFAYLYNPKDFLSEQEHGLFGYLDDAYFVVCAYERVMSVIEEPAQDDIELLDTIRRTRKYVYALIPEEAHRIEEMVEEAVEADSFEQMAGAFR